MQTLIAILQLDKISIGYRDLYGIGSEFWENQIMQKFKKWITDLGSAGLSLVIWVKINLIVRNVFSAYGLVEQLCRLLAL